MAHNEDRMVELLVCVFHVSCSTCRAWGRSNVMSICSMYAALLYCLMMYVESVAVR